MIDGYYLANEAAQKLTERAGRNVTMDDLRQMRRRNHIEGTKLNYNLVVYTQEQIDAATIPTERTAQVKRKKHRKRKIKASVTT